ncbi:MAG: ectonucleotide pyrophosphatase/phosphodiesterase [Sphingomonas sp.]
MVTRFGMALAAAAALAIGGCAPTPPPRDTAAVAAATAPAEQKAPVTILVSIDAFRADYLDRGITPVMSALAAGGLSAAMHPSFPSKTFPNHWAMVTGDYPDHSGITANKMEDPRRPGETFTMATDDPFWWDEAKPIWVSAEQHGVRAATMFWPGANVAWGGKQSTEGHHEVTGGTRPEDWQQFNMAVTGTQRVDAVIDWLRRPTATRPKLVTLYFDTVDTAGHAYGPDDPRTNQAIADVDQKIGRLVEGLKTLHQPANLIIVADHGMAPISSDRVVALDRIAPPADYRVVEAGPYASLQPTPGHEADLDRLLVGQHGHATCWRKENIPARFHYGSNLRIPDYFCLADPDWEVLPSTPDKPFSGGNHGYDNLAPSMQAVFIAHGPAFDSGKRLAPFVNVDVYALLRDLIGLPPATRVDGTDAPFRGVVHPDRR